MPVTLLDLLEQRAHLTAESANGLAVRLIAEGLRLEDHPLIYFRTGGSGIRRPALLGTRLDVWQVIATLRDSDNNITDAAQYLGLTGAQVRAAVQYYADFTAEIDAYAAEEQAVADRERERWERAQRVAS